MHIALHCTRCGLQHDHTRPQNLCTSCGKPLAADYDWDGLRACFTPDVIRRRSLRSMWRFAEVLPVNSPEDAVSMGEGLTPLIPCARRGEFARFERLYIKDESFHPTASFKARGMSAAITRAKTLGLQTVALPSAGNAAGAAAYYSARAGIACKLFVPHDTPPANIIEAVVAGAEVYLVNGLISDCGRLVRQGCDRFGWFDLSTLKEPFRLEGKKIMGYELAFDFADAAGSSTLQLPDVVIYPAGGGTGLVGMWKAFREMERLGWIGPERPRMVLVQAEGCAPIVRAYESGSEFATLFPNAQTCASGLRVPIAVGDFLMLQAVRDSGGTCLTVNDADLMSGVYSIARQQGIYACPEGGAVWRAAQRLADTGWLDPATDSVVLFNTGSGLKYNHLIDVGRLPELDHTDPKCLDAIG
jgi:threonine synthase